MLAKRPVLCAVLAVMLGSAFVFAQEAGVAELEPKGQNAAAEVNPGDGAGDELDAANLDPAILDPVELPGDVAQQQGFGRLVRIPLPIRGSVDTQVRRMLDQILSEIPPDGPRPTVVLEFWPPGDESGGSSAFGRSLDLARYLASGRTSGIRTVAWIPKTIQGHAVLVALACEQIVMHPDAKIGAAGIDESSIDPTVRRGYSEIADRRRTIPSAVALGMLDPELTVHRITTATGVRYVLSGELQEIQRTSAVQSIDTVIPAGEPGLLAGDKLRLDYGFVSHLASGRKELAGALGLSPDDLEIDPSLGGKWNAVRVDLDDVISTASVNRAMRVIEDRLNADTVNFICVAIDSPGGSIEESLRMANFLSSLESSKIRTVAYVENQARSDASIIALSCDQLVMLEDATLGGTNARELDADQVELATYAIREIMSSKNRRWSLPVAAIDPELAVHEYQLAGSRVTGYFCDEELVDEPDPGRWEKGDELVSPTELLRVDGIEALELGLARHVVSGFDEFRQRYQLEEEPEVLEPNWAHELVAALATPQVAAGLLFIGFFAMIAELSAPGVSVGGFIATLCFMLFFWSNFLQGTAGWLEVLLFVTGLVFIALEIFVLPGFGIFGLGGAIMVLVSLILASQTFVIPRTAQDYGQLPRSMLTVAGAMAGVMVSVLLLRRYLEESPLFRRVVLAPPEGASALELAEREAVVDYRHLLGTQGRTTTPLSPSGKALFADDLIDVVSDGLAVESGATIVVTEVAGNRVVVRESS